MKTYLLEIKMLTQARLKELLHYNPDTGIFTHKERTPDMFSPTGNRDKIGCCNNWNSRYAGKECGGYNGSGYIVIGIDYKLWRAHRLAFLYMTGELPRYFVDHINHKKDDNRWCNLRVVNFIDNSRNMPIPSNNTSGFMGVCWDKRGRTWNAKISVHNKTINLGQFKKKSDAIYCRKEANKKYGFHDNHGAI